jgi:hypothetical protein
MTQESAPQPEHAEPAEHDDGEQERDHPTESTDLVAHGSPDGDELPWTICGTNAAATTYES